MGYIPMCLAGECVYYRAGEFKQNLELYKRKVYFKRCSLYMKWALSWVKLSKYT